MAPRVVAEPLGLSRSFRAALVNDICASGCASHPARRIAWLRWCGGVESAHTSRKAGDKASASHNEFRFHHCKPFCHRCVFNNVHMCYTKGDTTVRKRDMRALDV